MPAGSSSSTGAGIEAWLSCFGKHPGWNDHIDEIGIETEFLTTAKRTLYVEGMSGNIDGGVWESYSDEERLAQFDHTIFSRSSGGLGIGRMWSSRDGKGRAKYPMLVMAQTRHAPMAWAGSSVLDILTNVEERCKAAESSSVVIETLDEARREIRQIAQGTPPASGTPKAPPTAIERLGASSELGPDGQGLLRVLYQIDRDCGPYLRQSRGDSGTKSRVFDIRPQSLRVPRCVPTSGESADLWMRLLYTVLDPATPLTVIVPEREAWVDIIVGVPNAAVLSCVKATLKKTPLTTEIPYTIDDAFRTRVQQLIQAHRDGDPDARVLGGDTDLGYLAGPGGPSMAKALQSIRDQAAGTRSLPLPILIGVGAGVLVLLILLLVFVFGGSPDKQQEASTSMNANANANDGARSTDRGTDRVQANTTAADANTTRNTARNTPRPSGNAGASADAGELDAATQQAWASWVNAADQWLLEFLNSVDLDSMRSDAHLAATIVPAVETLRSGQIEPHPARFAGDRPSKLTDLIASPPSRLGSASGRATAAAVVEAIEQIESGLSSWPVTLNAQTMLERINTSGQFAGLLRERLNAIDPQAQRGRALVAGIGAMRSLAPALNALGSVHDDAARLSQRLASTGEPFLTKASEELAMLPSILDNLTSQSDVLDAAEQAASWVNAANLALNRFTSAYPGVDPELFESRAPSYRALKSDGVTAVLLGQWAEQVRDPQYAALAVNLDPRAQVRTKLAEANESLSNINSRHGRDADPLIQSNAIVASLSSIDERFVSIDAEAWKHSTRERIEDSANELLHELGRLERTMWTIDTELSTSAEELLAQIDGHEVVSPTELASLDAAWKRLRNEARERYESNQDLPALRDWYESVTPRLERIAEAVSIPRNFGRIDGVSIPAAVIQSIQDAGRAEANTLVGSFASSADLVAPDEAQFASDVQKLSATMATWRDAVSDYVGSVFKADARLRDLVGLDEPADLGSSPTGNAAETLGEAFARLSTSALSRDDRIGPIVQPAIRAYREAAGVTTVLSADALFQTATNQDTHPGVAWAAWNTAVERGSTDLTRVRAGLEVQRRLVGSLGDADRRERLEIRLNEQARDAWRSASAAAQSWADFQAVRRRATEFLVDADAMSPGDRARSLFLDITSRLANGTALGEDDKLVVLDMTRTLRQQGAHLGWTELVEAADDMIPLLDGTDTGPVFDPSGEGPGALGWTAEASPDTQTIRYTWSGAGGTPTTLEFRALPAGSDGRVLPEYIMTREVSIADVIAICVSSGGWDQMIASLMGGTEDPRVRDSREGPRSWEWVDVGEPEQRIVPASAWLPDDYAGTTPYPEGLDPGLPSANSPMQWVPAGTALWLASRVGCRLPTSDEWRAALDAFPDTSPSNRRDFRWNQVREHAMEQESQRRQPRYPDAGVFVASREGVGFGRAAQVVTPEDDGTLWFAPTTSGSAWLGNVAELVTSRAVDPESGPGTVEGWSEQIRSGGLGVSVIGGSALSGPETDPMQAVGLSTRRADNGYSDVGFRLALTVGQAPRPHWTVLVGALLSGVSYPQ